MIRRDFPMRQPIVSLVAAAVLLGSAPAFAGFTLAQGKETPLLLNRTPPMFATDRAVLNRDLHARAMARIEGKVLRVTLSWDDPTEDAVAGAKRAAYGDDSIYRKPTGRTDAFGDAAALMLPRKPGARNPGIMMGDRDREVRMVLWRAGSKVETLHARGRGTVEKTPEETGMTAEPSRAGIRRSVTFIVRDFDPAVPMAFAVWDGGTGDRNGYKWYTPWYRFAR